MAGFCATKGIDQTVQDVGVFCARSRALAFASFSQATRIAAPMAVFDCSHCSLRIAASIGAERERVASAAMR